MRSRRSSIARGAALVLTAVAGFVDAMGYLALLHVYTANMSGNSVTVGMDAARGQWRESARRFLPIAAFFLGLLLAGIVIEAGRNWGITRRVSLALAVEAVCLLIFVPLSRPIARPGITLSQHPESQGAALVAVAAIAMGAQNATLRETGALNTYTTHVTGTLTRLSDAVVKSVARLFSGASTTRRANSSLTFLTSLWVIYVVGAAAGGAAWAYVGNVAMLAPMALVVAVIAVDLFHPLGRSRVKPSPLEACHA